MKSKCIYCEGENVYGKTCNLTVLMKKPFRMSDSDYFHEIKCTYCANFISILDIEILNDYNFKVLLSSLIVMLLDMPSIKEYKKYIKDKIHLKCIGNIIKNVLYIFIFLS